MILQHVVDDAPPALAWTSAPASAWLVARQA